ncbi:hypothetical protein B0A55_00397 [Friedmanniomyces simplex]|uniref:Uncharacterized protein n=1 Tax=Friedmanniomyces simplex TaxID=329884 RepID=A0A4U0Y0H4_9PEZI|nr:hypothetical protein B0A55_00397 [Friedmanniomyces simplex]
MGGNDQDEESNGFPGTIFQQMQAGHDRFIRELHEESRRFQQQPTESEIKPSSGGDNVFLSFKRFIDTNLGNLADSFRQFPDNIAELRAGMQEERGRRKQEELDIWRRWTGLEESPDHCQLLRDRSSPADRQDAVDAALLLLKEARDRNAHIPAEKIEALYTDDNLGSLDVFASPMLSPGGACYYQQDGGCNAPSTVIFRSDFSSHRWLSIDWFKRSPYSPVSLERLDGLQKPGGSWREAFEDLLAAALDKPMNSRERIGQRCPGGNPQSTRTGPGLDWMLSLQCRGFLPPQLPLWYNSSRTRRLPLTDELLEEQAKSIFRMNDFSQLIDEIATPAPQTLASSGVNAYTSDLPAFDETSQWEYFKLRADGHSDATARSAMSTARNDTLQDRPSQLELFEQRNQKRIRDHQREQEQAGMTKDRLFPDDSDDSESTTEQAYYEHLQAIDEALKKELAGSRPRNEKSGLATCPPPQPPSYEERLGWQPTGLSAIDLFDAKDTLAWALHDGDLESATQCFTNWHKAYGSVADLLLIYRRNLVYETSLSSHRAALSEALIRSDLPHTAFARQELCRPVNAGDGNKAEGLSVEEKRERRELVRRGMQVNAGVEARELLVYPTNAMRDLVEGLEQQQEALGLGSGNKVMVGSPAAAAAATAAPVAVAKGGADEVKPKVDVLSSLTTTQTTRLPDGTVTTKVVLKQRFADGREESEEKVHTYQESPTSHQQGMEANGAEAENKKGRGWFWS